MDDGQGLEPINESRRQKLKDKTSLKKNQLMVGAGLVILVLVLLFTVTPLKNLFRAPASPPEISLAILNDPQLMENGQYSFTVQAVVAGTPEPDVVFNRDDSLGEAGKNHALILLNSGDSFVLTAIARNTQGEEEATLELIAEMTTAMEGTIEGHLVYPSDHIPDMRIYAEETNSGLLYYTDEIIEDTKYATEKGFVLSVPPGKYHVYAVMDGDDFKAYYDRYVQSGFTDESTEKILVEVEEGQHLKDIIVGNWWGAAPNQDPVIAGLTIPSDLLIPGESYSMSVQASDPEGDPLSYVWSITGPGNANISNPQVNPMQWAPAASGDYDVQVTVSDNRGGEAVLHETVTVVTVAVRNPVTAETGFVVKDHAAQSSVGIYAGDYSNNRTCRGYISFDISEIDGTVKKVELIMSTPIMQGDPTFMHGTLGLWVGVVDWGSRSLEIGDYNLAGIGIKAFTDYDIAMVSIPGGSDAKLANELQNKINEGKQRFQIRLHYAQEGTDNDGILDGVAYATETVFLKVYYEE